MPLKYLSVQDMDAVFKIIHDHYSSHENIPDYIHENAGLAKLEGVLTGVRMDNYYPTFEDKAAYLLIQINKGHFFSNGNKRVALVSTLFFIFLNDYAIYSFSKADYRNRLAKLFPGCTTYSDYEDFLPEEFGFYNLSIIIADSEQYVGSFDELKAGVKSFLKFSIVRPPKEDK